MRVSTSFFITQSTLNQINEDDVMLTRLISDIVSGVKKSNKLEFTPKNKDWRELENKVNVQRQLPVEIRNRLVDIGDRYNITRSKLLTLLIENHYKKELV